MVLWKMKCLKIRLIKIKNLETTDYSMAFGPVVSFFIISLFFDFIFL